MCILGRTQCTFLHSDIIVAHYFILVVLYQCPLVDVHCAHVSCVGLGLGCMTQVPDTDQKVIDCASQGNCARSSESTMRNVRKGRVAYLFQQSDSGRRYSAHGSFVVVICSERRPFLLSFSCVFVL